MLLGSMVGASASTVVGRTLGTSSIAAADLREPSTSAPGMEQKQLMTISPVQVTMILSRRVCCCLMRAIQVRRAETSALGDESCELW